MIFMSLIFLIIFQFILQLMLPSKKVQDLSEISHPDLHYIFVNNRPIKHKDLEKVCSAPTKYLLSNITYVLFKIRNKH